MAASSVAGSPRLREAFEQLRLEIIRRDVRRDTLQEEVRSMRERMRRELSKSRGDEFDMKQDPGGIADIEFLAQYWALRWAADYYHHAPGEVIAAALPAPLRAGATALGTEERWALTAADRASMTRVRVSCSKSM